MRGRANDRYGSRPVQAVALPVAAASFTALSAAALIWTPHALLPILPLVVLWGLSVWGFFPAQQARLVGATGIAHTSVVLSLNASFMYLGFSFGAALGSIVISGLSVAWIGAAGAVCMLGAMISSRVAWAETKLAGPFKDHPSTAHQSGITAMNSDSHQTTPTRFVVAHGIRFAYRRFDVPNGVPIVLNQHFPRHPGLLGPERDRWSGPKPGGHPIRQCRHRRKLRRGTAEHSPNGRERHRVHLSARSFESRRSRFLDRRHGRPGDRLAGSRSGAQADPGGHRATPRGSVTEQICRDFRGCLRSGGAPVACSALHALKGQSRCRIALPGAQASPHRP